MCWPQIDHCVANGRLWPGFGQLWAALAHGASAHWVAAAHGGATTRRGAAGQVGLPQSAALGLRRTLLSSSWCATTDPALALVCWASEYQGDLGRRRLLGARSPCSRGRQCHRHLPCGRRGRAMGPSSVVPSAQTKVARSACERRVCVCVCEVICDWPWARRMPRGRHRPALRHRPPCDGRTQGMQPGRHRPVDRRRPKFDESLAMDAGKTIGACHAACVGPRVGARLAIGAGHAVVTDNRCGASP